MNPISSSNYNFQDPCMPPTLMCSENSLYFSMQAYLTASTMPKHIAECQPFKPLHSFWSTLSIPVHSQSCLSLRHPWRIWLSHFSVFSIWNLLLFNRCYECSLFHSVVVGARLFGSLARVLNTCKIFLFLNIFKVEKFDQIPKFISNNCYQCQFSRNLWITLPKFRL